MDPLQKLEHDHTHLNRMVASLRDAIQECLRGERENAELEDDFQEFLALVQEELFEHFEQEEQLLFPWVTELLPDTQPVIDSLEAAHDKICGSASRLEYLLQQGSSVFEESFDQLVSLFARFDANFVKHSREEGELLRMLHARLDPAQREHLRSILAAL
jgi:hemerythrin-like domain-containing protein